MSRGTGENLFLQFGSTELQATFRNYNAEETVDTVETTAGDDPAKLYEVAKEDGTASLELVDPGGTEGSAVWEAIKKGTKDTLEWGPEGTAAGKTKHTCTAIVTRRNRTVPYADVRIFEVDFLFSGQVTDDSY